MLKRVLKRWASLVLALIMVIGLLPAMELSAYAAMSGTEDCGNGLSVSYDCKDNGSCIWTPDKKTFTMTASGKGLRQTHTSTLTITSKEKGFLNFTLTQNGGTLEEKPDKSPVLLKEENRYSTKFTLTVTSGFFDSTATLEVSEFWLDTTPTKVTFLPAENGSYTVNGLPITEEWSETDIGQEYTVVATAPEGMMFSGWWNEEETVCYSFSSSASLAFEKDATVKPMFISENDKVFQVGSVYFADLGPALKAAQISSEKVAVLVKDYTVPKGSYTIPSGVTLLVPYNDAHTLCTTEPVFNKNDSSDFSDTAYKTLTMAAGANITVQSGGAISVAGRARNSQPYAGVLLGPWGLIKMEDKSNITLESGAKLYAWGRITGQGTVLANSGSAVYEDFQIADFRGGTASSSMNGGKKNKVFPFSQYYVQNVEVPLTLVAGATDHVYTGVVMSDILAQGGGTLIGGEKEGLFRLTDGSVTKRYDSAADRLVIEINGKAKISSISVRLSAFLVSVDIQSNKFVAPITNNMTVHVNSGKSLDITEDIAMLPGSVLRVDEGANLTLASGKNLYVYDSTEWITNKYVYNNIYFQPLPYIIPNKRTNASLTDAQLDLNGTMTVNGAQYTVTENREPVTYMSGLYTTKSGAEVISSKGTGKLIYMSGAGTATVTYQAIQTGSDITADPIAITPAQLKNADADDSYTKTAGAEKETTYIYTKNDTTPGTWVTRTISKEAWDAFAPQPQEIIYDGQHGYDLKGIVGIDAAQVTVTATTKDDKGEDVDVEACTDVGEYTVTFTCGDYAPKSTTLTIKPKPLTVNWTVPEAPVYNGQPHEVTATFEGLVEGEIFKPELTDASKTDAGKYTATATLPENVTNYALEADAAVTQEWEIAKATLTVNWTVPEKPVYNGQPHEVTATFEGLVEGEIFKPELTDASKTNAGKYKTKAALPTGTTNYVLAEGAAVTQEWEIAKATLTVTWPENPVYTGEAQTIVPEVEGVVGTDAPFAVSANEGTRADNYNATLSLTDTTNYVLAMGVTEETHEWEITKAEDPGLTVPTAAAVTYKHGLKLSDVVLTGAESDYGKYAWTNGNTELSAGENQQFEVTFVPNAEGENYEWKTKTAQVSVTVNKKEVRVSWTDPTDLTYNGEAKTVKAMVEGLDEGETVGLVLSGHEATDAGAYTATAELDEASMKNYVLNTGSDSHDWTITKADPKITVTTDKTQIEGEGDVTLKVTKPEQGTVTVSVNGNATVTDNGNGTYTVHFSNPEKNEPGTYTVTVKYDGGTNYNNDETHNVAVTVEHKHDLQAVEAVAATCTETGLTAGVKCSVCGEILTAQETIPAKGHTEETIPGKAATCTETGLTDGVRCSVCGEILTAQTETPVLGHDMQELADTAKAPTCTEDGKKADEKCSRCEFAKTGETTPMLGHNSDGKVEHKDASCTEDGVVGGSYCTRCGDGKTAAEAVITAPGHNAEGEIEHKDATCTEDGVVGGTYCTACDEGKAAAEAVITAPGHNSLGSVEHKDVTCTEDGVVGGKYCTVCNEGKAAAEAKIDKKAHNTTKTEAKAATCKTPGNIAYWTCKDCNKTFSDAHCTEEVTEAGIFTAIDTDKHTPGETVHENVVNATCTIAGNYDEVVYCTECGAKISTEHVSGGTLPHKLEEVPGTAVAPTCEEPGKEADKQCKDCDYTKTGEKIGALGGDHILKSEKINVVDATCTTAGSYDEVWRCTRCGEIVEFMTSHVQESGSGLGHDMQKLDGTAKEPTCTEDGKEADEECSRCKLAKPGKTTPKLGHNSDGEIEAVAATCTKTGVVGGKYCTRCGDGKTAAETVSSVLGHNSLGYVKPKAATCTEDGVVGGSYCTRCGDGKEAAEAGIPALDHAWDEGTVVIAATCVSEGEKTFTCKRDATHTKTEKIEIDPANHTGRTELSDVKNATCTVAGYTGDTYCADCGSKLADGETVEAKGHNSLGYVEPKAATCTEDGVVGGSYCTACNEGKAAAEAKIGKLDHNSLGYVEPKAATCTEDGVVGGSYCTACNEGKAAAEAKIGKLDHNSLGSVEHKDANCNEDGVVGGTYCTVCNEGKAAAETVLTKLGHNSLGSVEPKAATCTEDGVVGGSYCTRCGDGKEAAEAGIPALNHAWDEGTVVIAATCVSEGEKTFTCKRDATHTKTEKIEIDPANHTGRTELRDVKNATCTVEGYTGDTYCVDCGSKLADGETVEVKGHNSLGYVEPKAATCTEDGVVGGSYCTACNEGKAAAEAKIGKLGHNAEGKVEHKDASCTEDGVVGGTYCDRCGDGKKAAETAIPKLGHNSDGKIEAVAATCTKTGVVGGSYCTRCGDGKAAAETVSSVLGHNSLGYVEPKAATCTEDGVVGGKYCKRCGEGKAAAEAGIPALNHAWDEGTVVIAATCVSGGEKTFTCKRDATHTKTEKIEIDPANHTGRTELLDVKNATCTVEGYTGDTYCVDCGSKLADGETVEAKGHKKETIPGKAATCTETGLTDGVKCSVCGEILTAQETIPAKDHTEETVSGRDATCTKPGLTDGVRCSVCGEILTAQTETPVLGHDWEELAGTAKAPTCIEPGKEADQKCSRCEHTEPGAEIPAIGHVWNTGTVTTEATCTEPGAMLYSCTVCGETKTETIPATGHAWDNGTVTTAVTCTEPGAMLYSCTACGETKTETIPATEHSYQAYVTEPGCTEGGFTDYVCDRCGDHYRDMTQDTKPVGHDYQPVETVAPTCTEQGYTVYRCDSCGDEYHDDLAASGHSWDEGTEDTAPTCNDDGVMHYTCTVCNETRTEAISTQGHTPGAVEIENAHASSCMAEGSHDEVIHCAVCRVELSRKTVSDPVTEHSLTLVEAREANCTDHGNLEHYECEMCQALFLIHEEETEDGETVEVIEEVTAEAVTIEATGHEYEAVETVPPTCTEQGYTVYTCDHCGVDSFRGDFTEPGHSWDEGRVTTAPTTSAAGVRTYTCTVCGATRTESIDRLPGGGSGSGGGSGFVPGPGPGSGSASDDTVEINDERTPLADLPLIFEDVTAEDWFSEAVKYVYYEGMMNGVSDTKFSPRVPTNRGMIVTILYRLEGEPDANLSDFMDVDVDIWYTKAIGWAAENEIVLGFSETRFGPEQEITREQLAAILYRYAVYKGYNVEKLADLSGFADAEDISNYALLPMRWAVGNGLIRGVSEDKLDPRGSAIRAQTAKILAQFHAEVLSDPDDED